ncbi:hypothetical protein STEG23_002150 [Scotinomys teguina]
MLMLWIKAEFSRELHWTTPHPSWILCDQHPYAYSRLRLSMHDKNDVEFKDSLGSFPQAPHGWIHTPAPTQKEEEEEEEEEEEKRRTVSGAYC